MSRLRRLISRLGSQDGVTLVELMVVVAVMGVILGFVSQTLVSLENASTGAGLRLQNLDEARTLMDDVSKDVRTAARVSPTSSPFDVTACTATAQVQPCAPAGWGTAVHAAPYAGDTEMWFYANLTLANQSQGSPCPDIIHLFVDTSVNPPVLREQTVSDVAPTTDTPPNCVYGTNPGSGYTATYQTRLVGKYIVNGSANCATTAVPFVYWTEDGSGNPVAFTSTDTSTATGLSAANRLQVDAVGITFAVRQSTNYKVACATIVNRVRLANVDYNPIPSPGP